MAVISLSNKFFRSLPPLNFFQSRFLTSYASIKIDFSQSNVNDTIFHLCSGNQRCGISIIRISGPYSTFAFNKLTKNQQLPHPRMATMCSLFQPDSNEILDSTSIAIFFPNPKSYTGEDVLELHVHGSPIVVNGVLEALNTIDSCRFAQPGEFTRRAFENGKMDLTQIEGLADLINAETVLQRKQALDQISGNNRLGILCKEWHSTLTKTLAYIEAIIDFSDENDEITVHDTLAKIILNLNNIKYQMQKYTNNRYGELIRSSSKIVLLGAPNVGKSTLFNQIVQKSASIISPFPGTTRDIIEVTVDYNGIPLTFFDTAGICNSNDPVEKEGIQKTLSKCSQSDFKIAIFDLSNSIDNNSLHLFKAISDIVDENTIVIFNKKDLISYQSMQLFKNCLNSEYLFQNGFFKKKPFDVLVLSCIDDSMNNINCQILFHLLENFIKQKGFCEPECVTRNRHRRILLDILHSLNKVLPLFHDHKRTKLNNIGEEIVIVAEELRSCLFSLSLMTEKHQVENILDHIFQEFCLGK